MECATGIGGYRAKPGSKWRRFRRVDLTMDDPEHAPIEPADPRQQVRASLFRSQLETDVSVHVFTVSAGLIGVCLTVIGIIRISINVKASYSTIADELLAVDAFCFLAACLLAYWSLRTADRGRSKRREAHADRFFILGIAIMGVACGLVAFSLL